MPQTNQAKAESSGLDCFLTVEELAERLKVKPSWVYLNADDLGAFRLGKYLRFRWDRVMALLERRARAAGSLGSQPNDLKQGK